MDDFTAYEYLDHTADTHIIARGRTVEEAFSNATLAMFASMTDISRIQRRKEVEVSVLATNLESLLYDFLTELIYLFDVDAFLVASVDSMKIEKVEEGFRLHCMITGDTADTADKYDVTAYVKSATYNEMKIMKKEIVTAQFVLDI